MLNLQHTGKDPSNYTNFLSTMNNEASVTWRIHLCETIPQEQIKIFVTEQSLQHLFSFAAQFFSSKFPKVENAKVWVMGKEGC